MEERKSVSGGQPKVILISDSKEDLAGAVALVSEQVKKFRAYYSADAAFKAIKSAKPPVILFAMSSVQKNTQLYLEAIDKELLNYPHSRILLCDNKESGAAFMSCFKDLFIDYFVFKPMYEQFRLRMLVHRCLKEIEHDINYSQLKDEHFGRVSEELKELITQVSVIDEMMRTSIDKVHDVVNDFNDKIEGHEADAKELKNLLTQFNAEQLIPLLEALKQQMQGDLSLILQELTNHEVLDKQFSEVPNHSISLPRPEAKVEKASSENDQNHSSPQAANSVEPEVETTKAVKRILVVEDNDIYCAVLTKILIGRKYEVDVATSGSVALNKLKKNTYDLVMMDLFLPEMNGLQLTKTLRKESNNPSVPIIALTNNRKKEIAREWAKFKLAGYIVKPSSEKDILAMLDKVFE